jgi:hypothetical protein
LSSWTGTEAIGGFTRGEAHRAVMVHYRDKMRGSHFHTWSNDDTERPAWPAAKTRLEQTRNDEPG